MRGLNVYCCPSCGHYGFFQLSGNAVCPRCSIPMTPLPISYQVFMELGYSDRQILISKHRLHTDNTLTLSEPESLPSSFLTDNAALETAAAVQRELPPSGSSVLPDFDSFVLPPSETSNHSDRLTVSSALTRSEKSSSKKSSVKNTNIASDTPEPLYEPPLLTTNASSSDSKENSEIEKLQLEITKLRAENEKLEQTVSWMHDMIWDLTRRLHFTKDS